jgi:hypothetical protein
MSNQPPQSSESNTWNKYSNSSGNSRDRFSSFSQPRGRGRGSTRGGAPQGGRGSKYQYLSFDFPVSHINSFNQEDTNQTITHISKMTNNLTLHTTINHVVHHPIIREEEDRHRNTINVIIIRNNNKMKRQHQQQQLHNLHMHLNHR